MVPLLDLKAQYATIREEVRAALDLKPHVPVVLCDARHAQSAVSVLVELVQHLLSLAASPDPAALRHPTR